MTYRRFRDAVVEWTRRWMFELGLAQVVAGLGLWALAYLIHSEEPPIVLAMSAGALMFSGGTTVAVAAQDDDGEKDQKLDGIIKRLDAQEGDGR